MQGSRAPSPPQSWVSAHCISSKAPTPLTCGPAGPGHGAAGRAPQHAPARSAAAPASPAGAAAAGCRLPAAAGTAAPPGTPPGRPGKTPCSSHTGTCWGPGGRRRESEPGRRHTPARFLQSNALHAPNLPCSASPVAGGIPNPPHQYYTHFCTPWGMHTHTGRKMGKSISKGCSGTTAAPPEQSPYLEQSPQGKAAALLHISTPQLLSAHQSPVSVKELLVCPPVGHRGDQRGALAKGSPRVLGKQEAPGRVACGTDPDGFQDPTGSQLLHRSPGVKPGAKKKKKLIPCNSSRCAPRHAGQEGQGLEGGSRAPRCPHCTHTKGSFSSLGLMQRT